MGKGVSRNRFYLTRENSSSLSYFILIQIELLVVFFKAIISIRVTEVRTIYSI